MLHGWDAGDGAQGVKGKGARWPRADVCSYKGDPKQGSCLPLLAAQHDCKQLYPRSRALPCSQGVPSQAATL